MLYGVRCAAYWFFCTLAPYLQLKVFPKSVCILSAEKMLHVLDELKPMLND